MFACKYCRQTGHDVQNAQESDATTLCWGPAQFCRDCIREMQGNGTTLVIGDGGQGELLRRLAGRDGHIVGFSASTYVLVPKEVLRRLATRNMV